MAIKVGDKITIEIKKSDKERWEIDTVNGKKYK